MTVDLLRAIAPHVTGHKAEQQFAIIEAYGPILANTCKQFDINSNLRLAHFLGQTMTEADGYCTTAEYASGAEYEGRANLGNTHPGDGKRYKGRGLIQTTGRANYQHFQDVIGIPVIDHPELLEKFPAALISACLYWGDHRINLLADRDDLEHITRVINGGWNGLRSRIIYTNKAKTALGLPVTDYILSNRAKLALKQGH